MGSSIRKLTIGLGVTVALLLSGCAPHYPADPHRTLVRVTGGTVAVGVSHNEPFTSVEGPTPSGREVELVRGFADSL